MQKLTDEPLLQSRGFKFFFGVVFFASGMAGLVYQVVWQRLLTLYYGVGPISTTLVVSLFMLGLGTGSWWGGRMADRCNDPRKRYAAVELALGCFGVLSMPFLSLLGRFTAGSDYGVALLSMAFFLCVPTFLMGATLPLMVKIFCRQAGGFTQQVAFLYFINTLGAAFGAVLASYVIISLGGLDYGIGFSAAVNFILAAAVIRVRGASEPPAAATVSFVEAAPAVPVWGKTAFFWVFMTGFLALGYEIAWFRLNGVLIKDSPYAFSTILAVYLGGIAAGSFGMQNYLNRSQPDLPALFFRLQFWIALSSALILTCYYYATCATPFAKLTAWSFAQTEHPPHWWFPILHSPAEVIKYVYSFLDILLWPLFFTFIPAGLMGATFPVVSALAYTQKNTEGGTIGTVYFFNVLGNVLGSAVTGFFLLRVLGSEKTLLIFILLGLSAGLLGRSGWGPFTPRYRRVLLVLSLMTVSLIFFPGRGKIYSAMHNLPPEGLYFEEGIEGVVVTHEEGSVVRNFINGMEHGARPGYNFYAMTLEAAAFSPRFESVLVIGFGTGSTVEAVLKTPGVKRVVLVEINATLVRNLKKMELFRDLLADPRIKLIFDDGRRYLLRTNERFDAVLIDPLRSVTALSNNIYSADFFDLVRGHLTPQGIFLTYVDEPDVLPRTLTEVFPYVRLYNFFALASPASFRRIEHLRDEGLKAFSSQTAAAIEQVNVVFRGDRDWVRAKTKGFPVNTDFRPVSEYYLGLSLRKIFHAHQTRRDARMDRP